MYKEIYYGRRGNRAKEVVKEVLETIVCCAIFCAIMLLILNVGTQRDEYYYTSDGNGTGYIQLVDKPCTVMEINGDMVTVETCNGGEVYTFYGTGYEIGTEIICTFTMADELINTK